jgi:CRISPR-associated protein Cmr3
MAKSMFPPLPSTFYGALRSAVLAQHNKSIDDFHSRKKPYDDLPEVGTPDQMGTLSISGPCLAQKNEDFEDFDLYMPAPAHLTCEKEASDRFHLLFPSENDIIAKDCADLDCQLHLVQGPESTIVQSFNDFLSSNDTAYVLRKKCPEQQKNKQKNNALFKTFWQVGLERDRSRNTKEGQLYSAGHYQMPDAAGFYLKVSNMPDMTSGILKLGGEWRAAAYEKIAEQAPFNNALIDDIAEKITKNKRFLLWLITPAIFNNAYLPDFLDTRTLEGRLNGIAVKLIACQTKSKSFVGGFKLGKGGSGESKKGYYAVPAGSVYFFECLDSLDRDAAIQFVNNQMFETIKPQKNNAAQQGFGTTLIGGF